jgi:isoleucyl-tRNA synthetase
LEGLPGGVIRCPGQVVCGAAKVLIVPSAMRTLQMIGKMSKQICNSLESANNGEIFDKLFLKAGVSDSNKCDRCWNYRKEVGKIEKYPTLCNRCVEVIDEVEAQT